MRNSWGLHMIRITVSLCLLLCLLPTHSSTSSLKWPFGYEKDSNQLYYLRFQDLIDSQISHYPLWDHDAIFQEVEIVNIQYWAALRLCDFVFGQTRFEFPDGKSQPYKYIEASLAESRHDSIAFQCRERSLLFLDLCKRYIGISGRMVDIPSKHSFPLIQIGHQEFLLDPYDPIVQVNFVDSTIMNWNQVISGQSALWVRSRREFGPTYELIPQSLHDHFVQRASTPSRWMNGLQSEFERLLDSTKHSPNPVIPLHGLRQLRKTQSGLYPYAISLWDRQNGDIDLALQYGLNESIKIVFRPASYRHQKWQ